MLIRSSPAGRIETVCLLHNKSALGDRSQRVTYQLNDQGLVPTRLSLPIDWSAFKRVKLLTPRPGDDHVELVGGTEQIALAALDAVAVVVQELLHELGGPIQAVGKPAPKIAPE